MWEVLGANLVQITSYPECGFSMVFLSPSRQMPE
jgi:hypothetical protein